MAPHKYPDQTPAPGTIKAHTYLEVKDDVRGIVEAVIATYNVIDRDGDILKPGCVADGTKVAMSGWAHDAMFGKRPVGKGTLYTEGNELRFSGRVFVNNQDGRETLEVLKELGPQAEWSFGFRILKWENPTEAQRSQGAQRILTKLSAFETTPCLIGAGVGTRTLAAKEDPRPALTKEQQAELREIAERLRQDELREIAERVRNAKSSGPELPEGVAHLRGIAAKHGFDKRVPSLAEYKAKLEQNSELDGIALRAGSADAHRRPKGVDCMGLPFLEYEPDYLEAAAYFAKWLMLPIDRLPMLRIVLPERMRKALGCYAPSLHRVWIRKGMHYADTMEVLAHELVHADEMLRGWSADEDHARNFAAKMVRDFHSPAKAA